MKYEKFCNELIELVGGKKNIQSVTNCMTRLRFQLKDRNLAKTEEIKELKDVIDVVSNDVAYQVIIGTQVQDIRPEMKQILGLGGNEGQSNSGGKDKFTCRKPWGLSLFRLWQQVCWPVFCHCFL